MPYAVAGTSSSRMSAMMVFLPGTFYPVTFYPVRRAKRVVVGRPTLPRPRNSTTDAVGPRARNSQRVLAKLRVRKTGSFCACS